MKKRSFTPEYKTKIIIEILKEEKLLNEIAAKENISPNQLRSWRKEFLEKAPYLIILFKKSYELKEDKSKGTVYYATESCGLACGFLLAAIHHAGLVALTHTPSPMNFLSKVLSRPQNEKPFLLIPVGYPAEECWVPDLKRKGIEMVAEWY